MTWGIWMHGDFDLLGLDGEDKKSKPRSLRDEVTVKYILVIDF